MSVPETPPLKDISRVIAQKQQLSFSAPDTATTRTPINGISSNQFLPSKSEPQRLVKSGPRNEPKAGFIRNRTVSFSMLDGIQSEDSDDLPEPEDLIGMLRSKGKVVTGINDSSPQRSDVRFQVLEDITERNRNEMQGRLSGTRECEDLDGSVEFTLEDILECVDIV
jgi:hypothetical protein